MSFNDFVKSLGLGGRASLIIAAHEADFTCDAGISGFCHFKSASESYIAVPPCKVKVKH